MQTAISPWNACYGACRTLMASATAFTLMFNDPEVLFRPVGRGTIDAPTGLAAFSYFSLLANHLHVARWTAVVLLLIAAAGYRPRLTGILHWWLSASFMGSCIIIDGGDQIAAVLTLLLLPATLTDPRRWHWLPAPAVETRRQAVLATVAERFVWLARLQVAIVYLHAGVGKLSVPDWRHGTATYYWFLDTKIGFPAEYHEMLVWALQPTWTTVLLTWAPIALELALFTVIAMTRGQQARLWLFAIGIIFHAGNVVAFGLVSFFFTMAGALFLLCLPPLDEAIAAMRAARKAPQWRAALSAEAVRT